MKRLMKRYFDIYKSGVCTDITLKAFAEYPFGWESQADLVVKRDHLLLVTVYGFPVLDLSFWRWGCFIEVLGFWVVWGV